jgi:biopolymer transport protein TolQ
MLLTAVRQIGGALPSTPWQLITSSSVPIKIVLVVLVLFSAITWFVIVMKWWQFRRVRKAGDRFFGELERTVRLEDAYRAVMKLPTSAYRRLLKEGVNFFSELRPGALQDVDTANQATLSQTQLDVMKMMLAKDVSAERDSMARFITWLATIGSVSPLLGLLGTVLGVMDSFLGIAAGGSGNISAVAPGIAAALVTTVVGLAVAIPAVIAYNVFVNRLGL